MPRRVALSLLVLALPLSLAAQVPIAEYAARRDSLAAQLGDGVLLALGAHEPAQDYLTFVQSPRFYYLTGFREPDAALVMVKRGGRVTATLFVLPRDPAREAWTGARLGPEGAARLFGIPARPIDELQPTLDSLLGTTRTLYIVPDPTGHILTPDDPFLPSLMEGRPPVEVRDAGIEVDRLRSRHSAAELALERKAIDITVLAQREAMRAVAPGRNEFEIQALIEYTFRRNGADGPAFATIVGSGPNSTSLHYNLDDRFMNAGEVVVMDIGASYRGYAADVTRTLPVRGTFTTEQRALYQVVRDAQAAAERAATLGATAHDMDAAANDALLRGLAKLGLVDSVGAVYDPGRAGCARRVASGCSQLSLYYNHALGHGIGLEVHDPDPWDFPPNRIVPGSAFTIEPGLYVRAGVLDNLPDTPRNRAMVAKIGAAVRRYANIGIRIEDDYFATERGVEWISRAPREASEVEAAMRERVAGAPPRDTTIIDWYRKTAQPRQSRVVAGTARY